MTKNNLNRHDDMKLRYSLTSFLSCLLLNTAHSQDLTFSEAVHRTLNLSPRIKVVESDVESKAGDSVQAKLLPNPVAGWSVENVFGNKKWHGWNAAESRYEVAQLVELGGKRGYRSQVAEYAYIASLSGYEAAKLETLNRLTKMFVQVAANQEQLNVAEYQLKIAKEALDTVSAKLEAGKVSQIQQNKAEIALTNAQIMLMRSQVELFNSKERLAALWGAFIPDFERVDYPFFEIEKPRELNLCIDDLRNNPELIQSQYDHLAAHQSYLLQKSGQVPDVTISFGVKTLRDTGEKGMILGAALPIPVFNQNQGNIRKAESEIAKTHTEFHQVQLMLENKLTIAHKQLVQAYNEAHTIQNSVLKSANQTFELATEGYKEGKFEYLELLDAQRTLSDVMERYIQALLTYHQKLAEIEYLSTKADS